MRYFDTSSTFCLQEFCNGVFLDCRIWIKDLNTSFLLQASDCSQWNINMTNYHIVTSDRNTSFIFVLIFDVDALTASLEWDSYQRFSVHTLEVKTLFLFCDVKLLKIKAAVWSPDPFFHFRFMDFVLKIKPLLLISQSLFHLIFRAFFCERWNVRPQLSLTGLKYTSNMQRAHTAAPGNKTTTTAV